MGVLIRKNHGSFLFTGMAKLAFVFFLVSLAAAFIDTVWAVYLEGFLHNDSLVGFFSGVLSVLAFVFFFVLVPIIEKNNKALLYSVALILSSIVYFLLAINKNLILLFFLSVCMALLMSVRINVGGIMIKDKSSKRNLSRNEGLMYTFANIAWVLGPLIAGLIFSIMGFFPVFFGASLFMLSAFFIFKMSNIKDANIVKNPIDNVFSNFFEYFKDKDRVIAYFLGGGVTLWWSLIYIYMPLYIIHNDLNNLFIGIFLFSVAVPLILFEYTFAKIAGKVGSKILFQTGFFILTIMVVLCFFISNPYYVLFLLVFASVGTAMLEPTTEAYFFDVLKNKGDDSKFYGPYNTAIEMGLIFGKFSPAVLLLFLPFNYIFLLFGVFTFSLFIIATISRNVVEKKRG